ncbi:DUF302 domain-containing protein [Chloroflexota bacterium]
MEYGYRIKGTGPFAEVLQKTREELAKEGFGILTEIDVKATLKKKLNVDFDNYVILGACNPPFAYQALQAEREIGLLLPCNVIVYEIDGEVYVSAIVSTIAMSMVDNDKLSDIAIQVEVKLRDAVDNIATV